MPSGRGVDTKGVEASTHLVSVSLAGVRAHTLRDLTVHVEAVTAAPALEGTKREANQEVCRDGGRGGASSHSPLKAYCSCMTATSPTYSNTIDWQQIRYAKAVQKAGSYYREMYEYT